MANTGRSRSSSASRGGSKKTASRSNSRSNSGRKTSSRGRSAPVKEESGFAGIINKFAASKAAMPVIFLGVVILIVGLDLLISWNKYEMFFKILGIELLIAALEWGIMTMVFSGKKNKDSDNEPSDEV